MIALDTNILVYAHREEFPLHAEARSCIEQLVATGQRFAIPWPCAHEFFSVVTHPRRFRPPSTADQAFAFLNTLASTDLSVWLSEGELHLRQLESLVASSRIQGPQIHDARIAALCLANGIRELWTADRDFTRYPALKIRNPLILRTINPSQIS